MRSPPHTNMEPPKRAPDRLQSSRPGLYGVPCEFGGGGTELEMSAREEGSGQHLRHVRCCKSDINV